MDNIQKTNRTCLWADVKTESPAEPEEASSVDQTSRRAFRKMLIGDMLPQIIGFLLSWVGIFFTFAAFVIRPFNLWLAVVAILSIVGAVGMYTLSVVYCRKNDHDDADSD